MDMCRLMRVGVCVIGISSGTVWGDEFTATWSIEGTAFQSADVTVVDVDQDTDPDLILSDPVFPSPLLLNDGQGRFSPADSPGLGGGFCSVAGDVNGDGLPDVVFGRLGVTVYTNAGNAVFAFDGNLEFGGTVSVSDLALLDLDGDLDLDLVVPTDGPSTNRVFLNDGNGVFTASAVDLGSERSRAVAVADLNGDTRLDILLGLDGTNALYLGTGGGGFVWAPAPGGDDTTRDIDVGDLNGDTFPDVWLSGPDGQAWLNDGSGGFTQAGGGYGPQTEESVLVDVDGDLDLDAVTATGPGDDNAIWRNDGAGLFTAAPATLGSERAVSLAFADLDDDSDLDVIMAADTGPSPLFLRVPPAQGGPFRFERYLTGGVCRDAAAGDVDDDSDLDIVAALGSEAIYLIENDGAGGFTIRFPSLVFRGEPLALLDADRDGDPDLFAYDNATETGRLFLNDGSAAFSQAGGFYPGVNPQALEAADLDGDGWTDLVVGKNPLNADPGQNQWLRNNSNNTFAVFDDFGTDSTLSVGVGDLNGDLDLEVVAGNTTADRVWRQSSPGVFVEAPFTLGNTPTRAVEIADFNGDMVNDILALGTTGGTNLLYLNSGNGGSFTSVVLNLNGIANPADAAILDVDEDGDLDIYVGNGFASEQADRIYFNNGDDTFTMGAGLGIRETRVTLAGDFDGDGLEDVWVGSGRGNHALYSRRVDPIVAYAESFGLTGGDTDPRADPDLDDLPNWAEFAFALNPDLPDNQPVSVGGSAGAPRAIVGVTVTGNEYLGGLAIQPIGISSITYSLRYSEDLSFTLSLPQPGEIEEVVSPTHQRVLLRRFANVGGLRENARVEVDYAP